MLNGRFQDNEFTCISTSGKSVVDYICVPYEEMEFITDFKIVSMSTISNIIAHIPDIKFSIDLCLNSQEIPNNDKRKYNISLIPNDFLVNAEIQVQLFEAFQKIENDLEISKDVQNAYDEFQLLVKIK